MAVKLPTPIAGYFSADRSGNGDAISRYFTDSAAVRDEGLAYIGREAIARWKNASSQKYSYTAEPIAIGHEAGASVVTVQLIGDFPGSPVDLRYRFALEGERIAGLEIGV
jgi:hypothetical protein